MFKKLHTWAEGILVMLRGLMRHFFYRAKTLKVDTMLSFYGLQAKSILHSPSQIRKRVERRAIRLWADRGGYDRIVTLVDAALYSVIVHMFIWQSDEAGTLVASALLSAADRGVKVSIIKDSVGDFFELSQSFIATRTSENPVWKRFWNHPNIDIQYAPHHSHAKVFIIDNAVILLTGMNLANEYRYDWHDYLMELWGPNFIEEYLMKSKCMDDGVHVIVNKAQEKAILPCVMQLLASAKRSIILQQAYFSHMDVIRLLQEKSKQGVRISLILPSNPDVHHNANMEAVAQLMAGADRKFIRVYLYPKMVHGKVILVDRLKALVGSANMNPMSLDDMGEACVLFDSSAPQTLLKLKRILFKDILKSKEMDAPPGFSIFRKIKASLGL